MKISSLLTLTVLLGFSLTPVSGQEKEDPTVGLSRVAERYVAAYNEKNLDGVLALFTPDAEMIDEIDALAASGTDEIRDIFESSFTKYPDRRISLEVLSVRQVAETVVVEDGIASFSGEVPNEEGDVVAYSAVLVKDAEKGWLIAASRELKTDTPPSDPLAALYPLEGDWTMQGDQMRMDLSYSLAPSGRFLLGTAFITTPADGTMENEIRIGYDPALGQIRWWTFDEMGGFSEGTWHKMEQGWLVRTTGVTADGEATSAIQEMNFVDKDTIVWKSTRRFLDGETLPDLELRLERRPPLPFFSFDSSESEETSDTDTDTGDESVPEAATENTPDPAAAPAAEPTPSTSPKP